jgi:hypothetical protein
MNIIEENCNNISLNIEILMNKIINKDNDIEDFILNMKQYYTNIEEELLNEQSYIT